MLLYELVTKLSWIKQLKQGQIRGLSELIKVSQFNQLNSNLKSKDSIIAVK